MGQKLILITGSPCVGKTLIGDKLYQSFNNSAWLDGDWVWRVNPFSVEDPRLRDGDKSMSFVLSTYLKSKFDYVFFTSVIIIDQTIRENILNNITEKDFRTMIFHLTCGRETLRKRHGKRGDKNEVSYFWLELKPLPGDIVINTDDKTPKRICNEMIKIING
jgi:broad-specificity NMP kinase